MYRYILWALAAIAMIWAGGQGVYSAMKNPDPLRTTCAEYVKSRPADVWVELSQCIVRIPDALYAGKDTNPSEVFIPVVPEGDDGSSPPVIVLASKDKVLRDQLAQLVSIDAANDEKKTAEYLVQNMDRLFLKGSVDGMIQFGIDLNDDQRGQIASLASELDKNFVIIDSGEKPAMGISLFMLIGGVALSGLFVFRFLRRRRDGMVRLPLPDPTIR